MTKFFRFKNITGLNITLHIFETIEKAKMCTKIHLAMKNAKSLQKQNACEEECKKLYVNNMLLSSDESDIFFLISKEKGKNADVEYLQVIVGEKFGWIIVPYWFKTEEIN